MRQNIVTNQINPSELALLLAYLRSNGKYMFWTINQQKSTGPYVTFFGHFFWACTWCRSTKVTLVGEDWWSWTMGRGHTLSLISGHCLLYSRSRTQCAHGLLPPIFPYSCFLQLFLRYCSWCADPKLPVAAWSVETPPAWHITICTIKINGY